MKTIIKILMLVFFGTINTGNSFTQETQRVDTTQFHVSGVCGQCKTRIENAAFIKDVKWAQWDIETGVLTVIYRPDKVDIDALHNAVADAGHDTEKVKAPDEAYRKLPRCCAYRDGISNH